LATVADAIAAQLALAGGLREQDFRLVADSGFGDGANSYAHSMAWFEGCLYVGSTRATFAMMRAMISLPDLEPWPILAADDVYDADRRAQINRFDPKTGVWTRVYQAPWVPSRARRPVPRYVGFRGMAVFQSPRDQKPCLYVSTWAPVQAEPPDILRCEDGTNFDSVPRPPWDKSVRSFRTLQTFKGRVHTSPTGSNAGQGSRESVGSEATIYSAADLHSGDWKAASPEGFGSKQNLTVFEMAEFNGHLYAGTVNAVGGCELWKTDGAGGVPYQWKRVLARGGDRGPFNEVVVSLQEFNGALYVGTGIINGGYHRELQVGPAAAEIIRVWPDDSWDLIVGHPRTTEQGLKVPLSGYSPGFDNLFNGYIWRMSVHDGWLYAGTFNWINMMPYLPLHKFPEDVLTLIRRWGAEELVRNFGGCNLWRTQNGTTWECTTRSGFQNKYNWGIRTMASTPYGLFVGTANVFGPWVAAERDGEWGHIPNDRAGLEVWLGAPGGPQVPRKPMRTEPAPIVDLIVGSEEEPAAAGAAAQHAGTGQ